VSQDIGYISSYSVAGRLAVVVHGHAIPHHSMAVNDMCGYGGVY
jgi:hypothetical protein